IVRVVIRETTLSGQRVQVQVTVGRGGTEFLRPMMRIANGCPETRYGLQIAAPVKRGIIVDKVVVHVAEDSTSVRELGLNGVAIEDIEAGSEIESPANHMLITHGWPL